MQSCARGSWVQPESWCTSPNLSLLSIVFPLSRLAHKTVYIALHKVEGCHFLKIWLEGYQRQTYTTRD